MRCRVENGEGGLDSGKGKREKGGARAPVREERAVQAVHAPSLEARPLIGGSPYRLTTTYRRLAPLIGGSPYRPAPPFGVGRERRCAGRRRRTPATWGAATAACPSAAKWSSSAAPCRCRTPSHGPHPPPTAPISLFSPFPFPPTFPGFPQFPPFSLSSPRGPITHSFAFATHTKRNAFTSTNAFSCADLLDA